MDLQTMPDATAQIVKALNHQHDKYVSAAAEIRTLLHKLTHTRKRVFTDRQRQLQSAKMREIWRQRKERGYYERGA